MTEIVTAPKMLYRFNLFSKDFADVFGKLFESLHTPFLNMTEIFFSCFVIIAKIRRRHIYIAVADMDEMAAVGKAVVFCNFIKKTVSILQIVKC